MATYVNNLRLTEITTGDESGTWGTTTNANWDFATDAFGYGVKNMAADADQTFTMADGTVDTLRSMYLKITSTVASLTATRTLTIAPNTVSKLWVIENATTGSQSIIIKQGSGADVTIATGTKTMLYTDGAGSGAAVFNASPSVSTLTGTLPVSSGGTGQSSNFTQYGVVYAPTTTTLGNTGAGTTTTVLHGNVGGAPTYAAVSLTADVSGALPAANGGTGVANNAAMTVTGSGNFAYTRTLTGATNVTLPTTGTLATLAGTETFTNKTLTSPAIGTSIKDTNANTLVAITATGSAVNNFTIANAAAAANPVISATGSDTNIGISLTPKGTGEVLATASYLTGVFSDKVTAIGNTGTSQTIACTSGTVFTATLNGNCTFTLSASNSVASRGTSFTLILTNDGTPGRTVTLAGATFKYAGGSIARTTTASAVDIWFFFSPDGGTTFYVSIPMKNVS